MDLAARLLAGDQLALARAISAVENGADEAGAILAAVHHRVGGAAVIGFTGAPGAGKSTLVGSYVTWLRARGRKVAVLAVDPSSPHSGGAVLGDRVRMPPADADGLFIRSLAARGNLGGLSPAAPLVIDLMDAAGFDTVVIETVGTGQSEIDIAALAAVTVVVCAPGMGDQLQAIKAGLLEIADVLVVNKGDSPLAAATVRDFLGALHRRADRPRDVPVLTTTATTGAGVKALAEAIAQRLAKTPPPPTEGDRRLRRMLAALAAETMRAAVIGGKDPRIDDICAAVRRGGLTVEAAVRLLSTVWFIESAPTVGHEDTETESTGGP